MDGKIQTIIGRGGASLVASKAGDKLFLIGGFAGKEMDDIYIYDLNKKVWGPKQHTTTHGEGT